VDTVQELLNLVPAASTPSVRSLTINSARTKTDTGGYSKVLDEGDIVYVTVEMTEAVTVTPTGSTPTIALNVGGVSRPADYDSSTSTSTLLSFKYTLINEDFDFNGISISAGSISLPAGVAIQNSNGTAANRSYSALADDPNYRVDTLALSGTGNNFLIKGKQGTDNSWYFYFDPASGTTDGGPDSGDRISRSAVNALINEHNSASPSPSFSVALTSQANIESIRGLSSSSPFLPAEWSSGFSNPLYHYSDDTNGRIAFNSGVTGNTVGDSFAVFKVL
jgi:hypothetical protein